MEHSRNQGKPAQELTLVPVFSEVSDAQPVARKKRKAARPPFSLRLTDAERARLEQDAGRLPLGVYVRSRLFDGPAPVRRTRERHPVKDHQLLAKVLGEFGQSRIANNLNQLAKAVNYGELLLKPDEVSSLLEACEAVKVIRYELVRALGLDAGDRP